MVHAVKKYVTRVCNGRTIRFTVTNPVIAAWLKSCSDNEIRSLVGDRNLLII